MPENTQKTVEIEEKTQKPIKKVQKIRRLKGVLLLLQGVLLFLLILAFVLIGLGAAGVFGDENSLLNQYLPDSLGGFAGVFGGFLVEFIFVQKISDLKKREALYKLLSVEFRDALKDMQEIKDVTDFDQWKDKNLDKLSIKVEEAQKGKDCAIQIFDENQNDLTSFNFFDFFNNLYEIHLPILEDIMDSAENLSVLEEEMLYSFRIVNINYLRFNDAYKRASEVLNGTRENYNKKEEIRIAMKSLCTMTKQMTEFTKEGDKGRGKYNKN